MDDARKTALITGASGGIGEGLARECAAAGMNVVLVARSEDKLEALADRLSAEHGITATPIASDLSDADAPATLKDALDRDGIAVDVLINNAGFATFGPFIDSDAGEELEEIQLNVTSLTHLSRLFMPGMVERGWGRVMNVASTAAFQPGPLMAVYYATKAYVLSFSEALSEEMRGTGVKVTALCPGPTVTGFQTRAAMEDSKLVLGRKLPDAATVAAAGFKAMMAGKPVYIHGLRNRLLAHSIRFSPRAVVRPMVKRLQERVH